MIGLDRIGCLDCLFIIIFFAVDFVASSVSPMQKQNKIIKKVNEVIIMCIHLSNKEKSCTDTYSEEDIWNNALCQLHAHHFMRPCVCVCGCAGMCVCVTPRRYKCKYFQKHDRWIERTSGSMSRAFAIFFFHFTFNCLVHSVRSSVLFANEK